MSVSQSEAPAVGAGWSRFVQKGRSREVRRTLAFMVAVHLVQLPLLLVAVGVWESAYPQPDDVIAVRLLAAVGVACGLSRIFLALRAWGLIRARRADLGWLRRAGWGLRVTYLFAGLGIIGDIVAFWVIGAAHAPRVLTWFGYHAGEFVVPWFGAVSVVVSLLGVGTVVAVAYWPDITHPMYRSRIAEADGGGAGDADVLVDTPASLKVAEAERSEPAAAAKATGDDIIICCSGGGIRAAAFSLGGLQVLQDKGIYRKASAVVGVSGGGYTAAAHHVTRWNTAGSAAGTGELSGNWDLQPDWMPAYAADSPELHYLRRNTRYIMDNLGTVVRAVLSLTWGIAVNVILVLIAVGALGWLLGWLFLTSGRLTPGDGENGRATGDFGGSWGVDWQWIPWLCAAVLVVGAAAFATEKICDRVFTVAPRWRSRGQLVSKFGLIGGAVLAGLLLGLPWLVEWVNNSVAGSASAAARLAHQAGIVPDEICAQLYRQDSCGAPSGSVENRPSQQDSDLRAIVASVSAVVTSILAVLATLTGSGDAAKGQQGNVFSRLLRTLWGKFKDPVVPYLAVTVIAVVVLAALIRTVSLVVTDKQTIADWRTGLILAAALIAIRLLTEPNRTSLHQFFRERISNAFFVRRSSEFTVAPIDYHEPLRFSKAAPASGPRLVACAVANVSDPEVIPSQRGCTPFVFDDAHMGLTDRMLPNDFARRPSAMFEFAADYNYRDATIPAAVAMSAAAFSPLAGRENAKVGPYRVVLALGNARLGVWLPNPMWIDEISLLPRLLELGRHCEAASMWSWMGPLDRSYLLQTCAGIATVSRDDWEPIAQAATAQDRDAARRRVSTIGAGQWRRLKAVHVAPVYGSTEGELVGVGGSPARPSLPRRLWELGRSGFKKPGIFSLVQEAFGKGSVFDRFLYVTDGGHYDNLGLIEALRRRPDEIYVLDASNDPEDTFRALGQAMATAKMDLGAVVTIDPREMARLAQPHADAAWCSGTYRYVNGDTGRLHVAKAVLTGTDPWDIEAYRSVHPDFPRTNTGRQLYSEFDFEAYRALGHHAVSRLLEQTRPRPVPPAENFTS